LAIAHCKRLALVVHVDLGGFCNMSQHCDNMRLVIKHTFLQVERCELTGTQINGAARCRAMTDTLIGYSLAMKSLCKGVEIDCESDGTTTLGDVNESNPVFMHSDSEPEVDRSVSLPTKMPPGTFHMRTESLSRMCWADCSPAHSRFALMDETDDRTTLMFRNLPDNQVVDDFLNLLNREGFKGTYDFAYMPMDFQKQVAVGYAFVNFTSRIVAQKAWCHFDGFKRWCIQSCDKVCEVKWSNAQQGVAANVERYRNSPVMHDTVDDKHKPRLFAAGRRVSFPAPTEKIRPPKMRRSMKRPA